MELEEKDRGSIVIREANIRDLEQIFRIQQESLWIDKEDKDWLSAFIKLRSKRRLILVAEDPVQNEVIGFLSAYKYRDRAYIDTIAISRGYRGRGSGGLLLEEAERKLREKGAAIITLSVKKENTKALDFYLRKDYHILKVVLALEANTSDLQCEGADGDYVIKRVSPAKIRYGALRRATWWSMLMEPVDRLIYKKMYKKGEAIVVLKKKRVRGFVEYNLNSKIDVDNIGLSSYTDEETLRAIICKLAEIGREKGIGTVRIYVDSSKAMMIKGLEDLGFRVVDAEFLLGKSLSEEG